MHLSIELESKWATLKHNHTVDYLFGSIERFLTLNTSECIYFVSDVIDVTHIGFLRPTTFKLFGFPFFVL